MVREIIGTFLVGYGMLMLLLAFDTLDSFMIKLVFSISMVIIIVSSVFFLFKR